jgi:hypothetical protein
MSSKPDDVTSDPSLDDGESADWSGEGGSTPDGPATDPEADDPGAGESSSS